ncbi:prepilin peptidase [Desulfitobacterium sp. Sab5]|uniref:A24 family peptidase n=1 Tax=Desulfitobacterium nosdiversum TaxID=3375356 RepID=UPI003CECCBFE
MGLNDAALALTISIAAFTDFREHRIYNKLLGPAFVMAIALQIYFKGWIGLRESLFGAFIGFLILLIPYFLGGIGAGDVKLLAVIGAFGGVHFVITSFLYGAIVGGIISVILLARRGALYSTLHRFLLFYLLRIKIDPQNKQADEAQKEKFPYGIAITIGTLLAMLLRM